ncbi:MAG: tetratricopeptide repeat protein [Vampirovibrionales bacterium]|nr:tetratricopeptide repeat protein [Vampirovibrionales bacterium]
MDDIQVKHVSASQGVKPEAIFKFADKLAILPFVIAEDTGPEETTALNNFEVVLTSGIAAKYGLITEHEPKCLKALTQKPSVVGNLIQIYNPQALDLVATEEQCQFLLAISLCFQAKQQSLRLCVRIGYYDTVKARYLVDDELWIERCLITQSAPSTLHIPKTGQNNAEFANKLMTKEAQLVITPSDMNRLIDWIVHYGLVSTRPNHNFEDYAYALARPISKNPEALKAYAVAESIPSKSLQEKIAHYENVINFDVEFELAYRRLGALYKAARAIERSLICYKRALDLSGTSPRLKAQYANEIGICYALINNYDDAIKYWQRAITLTPDHVLAYYNVGHAYESKGEFANAAEMFLKAKQYAPNDTRLWTNLARVYSKLDKWPEALEAYQKQLKANPADPWCHSNIANCYLHLGETSKAKQHFERALELEPNGEAANFARLVLVQLMSDSAMADSA